MPTFQSFSAPKFSEEDIDLSVFLIIHNYVRSVDVGAFNKHDFLSLFFFLFHLFFGWRLVVVVAPIALLTQKGVSCTVEQWPLCVMGNMTFWRTEIINIHFAFIYNIFSLLPTGWKWVMG